MLEEIVSRSPFFLLIYARCIALLLTLPLFSMRSVSRIVKLALAFYMAYILLPLADHGTYSSYISDTGSFTLIYVFLLLGEAMIGIVMGFFVSIIFSAFSTAGQFFAFQMGLSASEVYDSLSQVENPLMGQYLNLIAMLVFLQSKWFQKLFLRGLVSSISSMNVFALIEKREGFAFFFTGSLTRLFSDALVISLPLMGTLLLVSVSMGLLSRAAPQMNLLAEGFAVMLPTSFLVFAFLIPYLFNFFERTFDAGLTSLIQIIGG